jgi:endo-1,4-beta-D-glucanase Y
MFHAPPIPDTPGISEGPLEYSATDAPRRRGVLRAMLGLGATATLPGVALAPSSGVAGYPILPAPPGRRSGNPDDQIEWGRFRDRFIADDGRVVDTANGGISHSEGQGYAMLLSQWAGDRATFERLLTWTRLNLSRPHDALFAWCLRPGQAKAAQDRNNATDGDIMIAWALERAAERWSVPEWSRHGAAIANDVLRLTVRRVAGRTVLLPGARGFEKSDRVVLNPSYYNLPGLRSLSRLAPDPAWVLLEADAQWLLNGARFGRWSLPADWVELLNTTGVLVPASGWPPRFSWDAVRVPLFLTWAGQHDAPAVRAAANFWASNRSGPAAALPAWTDLRSNALSPYAAHAGIVAVAAVTTAASQGDLSAARLPPVASATDYYGSALVLLARMARQEGEAVKPLLVSSR